MCHRAGLALIDLVFRNVSGHSRLKRPWEFCRDCTALSIKQFSLIKEELP